MHCWSEGYGPTIMNDTNSGFTFEVVFDRVKIYLEKVNLR